MSKLILESTAGRIRWISNMWALIGSKWDKRRVVSGVGTEIMHGNKVLVKKLCTRCPHPPGDDFAYDDKKWWSVPATECRKCSYHRASNRSFRFPRCTWKKPTELSDVAKETMVQIGGMIDRAVKSAEDIVKG